MTSRRLVTLALLLGMALNAAAWAGDSKRLDPKQAYVKRATWAETMLLARANCARAGQARKEGELASTPLPALWAKIQADWPAESAWFVEDLPYNRYLDWFLQANNTGFESWIMGLILARLGDAGGDLRQELAGLGRGGLAPGDPRWLELYARASRFEDVHSASRRVWLGDLRREYEKQAAEMVRAKVPSNDARWTALSRWVSRCATPGKVVHAGRSRSCDPRSDCWPRPCPAGSPPPAIWQNSLASRSRDGAACWPPS